MFYLSRLHHLKLPCAQIAEIVKNTGLVCAVQKPISVRRSVHRVPHITTHAHACVLQEQVAALLVARLRRRRLLCVQIDNGQAAQRRQGPQRVRNDLPFTESIISCAGSANGKRIAYVLFRHVPVVRRARNCNTQKTIRATCTACSPPRARCVQMACG